MNDKQQRALTIILLVTSVFVLYFLRHYIGIIALAAIAAFLFNPIYKWLLKVTHQKDNLAVLLTLLIAFLMISVPIAIVLIITVDQAFQLANVIKQSANNGTSISNFIQSLMNAINHLIDKLPGHLHHVSSDQAIIWLKNNISGIIKSIFNYVAGFAGSFASYLTKTVIFVFMFISFLKHQTKWLNTLRRLNPLNNQAADLYLSRMGAMTSAMVKGQFAIATLQGLIDAGLLYIVGIHYFIFWFVLITALSIIPLGGGIIVIPVGLVLLATGHIWQGLTLIVGHILIVTNIDNVLRPHFVPKKASLDPALTILGVFAGVAMFGFLGVIIGPVLMIFIVTTIQTYIAIQKSNEAKLVKQLANHHQSQG